MSVTQQSLLDAMDGIVLILDTDLHITRVGRSNWRQFLDEEETSNISGWRNSHQDILARTVTQFMAGDTVRATFADLFQSVLSGKRPVVQFHFRCDAPTVRRDMRLSVRPIATRNRIRHLLYQSVVLSVEQRPAIRLFGAAVTDRDDENLLTLCTICARVAWPIGAPAESREWIEPSEYYRRGGQDVALISHGFCTECFARLHDEG